MTESFRIAIAGLGTVGMGVLRLLHDNGELLKQRTGVDIEIVGISARDQNKDRGFDLSSYHWTDTPNELLSLSNIDAVIELIGGSEGPAYTLVDQALEAGINVVTANKALLAARGFDLAALAEEKGAFLGFEAAVAGGIPAIKGMRDGLAANNISAIYGILNGTCNYILTQMQDTGAAFSDVLKIAQDKGYAEADPSFDIDGVDSAHKICLLAAAGFGIVPDFDAVHIGGIRHIRAEDIVFARELGYKIKLLGMAERHEGGYFIGVEPCLVPNRSAVAAISGVNNAVLVRGDQAGDCMFTGRGAGAGPTASAVVSDIIDLARGVHIQAFGQPAKTLRTPNYTNREALSARYYLRLMVLDQPGVLADISAILRDHNISIEGLVQRGHDPGQPVFVMITTHQAIYGDLKEACTLIDALSATLEPTCMMRMTDGL